MLDTVDTLRLALFPQILGASLDKEFSYSSVFEEILHRLPKVQSLTVSSGMFSRYMNNFESSYYYVVLI